MVLSDRAECGHRVSTTDSVCPECGHPLHVDASVDAGATDPTESSQGGWWDRRPTWFLLVLVFAVGSGVLVAVGFAVVVLTRPVLDELSDWNTASDPAPDATTATTAPAGGRYPLEVGECIDVDELVRYLSGDVFSVTACSDPHEYEVYFVWEYAPGPYPGEDAVRDELTEVCLAEFEGYVGHDFGTSSVAFHRLSPEQSLWESGYRIGECLLFDLEGEKLTGSAYQSGW